MMKKCFAWMLLLLCLCTFGLAEEAAEGYGAVTPGDPAELQEMIELAERAPYVPEGVEKAVFGVDDRATINQTGKYPYSAIAYLKVKGSCGCSWTGSGFMVGQSSLATAAHCLVCEEHDAWVSGLTMYFGYRSDKNYTYCYSDGATYWYGSNPYVNGSYIEDDDYAYLKLEKKVGDRVGWFGIRHANAGQHGQVFTVAGYRHGVLKTSNGTVGVRNDKILEYQTDTEPGYSGCPVFDSEYYAVAINVGHNSVENFARRFTTDVVTEMRQNGMFD